MPMDSTPDFRLTQPMPSFAPWTATRVRQIVAGPAISAHSQPASCIATHPLTNVVATGSDDGTVSLWSCPGYASHQLAG